MTVTLIGGEMLVWSDLSGEHGPPPAGGPVLRPLLPAGGRVLVAGPHDPALIGELAGDVTVLVRGVADAERLAAEHSGVTVCCGSLEKLAATPAYDSVIALDGLERLHSAEAEEVGWDEALGRLLAVLRPQGRLLLRVENLFGLHRLVALPPAPTDSDWVTADQAGTPARLRDRLAEAGFPVARSYAAYPDPAAPALLIGDEALTDPALHGHLAARLASLPRAGTLADPVRLAVGALRHDLAAALAPAWILEAGGGDRGPAVLAAVDDGVATVRRDAAGRWNVPLGRTVEELLLTALRRHAVPAVREILTAWQSSDAATVPADQVVIGADGRHHAVGAPGEPLAALARTVIENGLWPLAVDEAELAATLAGMTGREAEPRPVAPIPGPGSVRELTIARDRLERELAEARAQHDFYERAIAGRDAELRRVRLLNAALMATVRGRVTMAAIGGLRAARRRLSGRSV